MTKKRKSGGSELVLTVAEAAAVLGLSINKTYQAVKSGQIPSIKFGKAIRVPRSALLRKLEDAYQEQIKKVQQGAE